MSKYHDRTLTLLGAEGVLEPRPVPQLIKWARSQDIVLPKAFLEWAQLDHANLLGKYSNDDWFGFETPTIVITPEGVRGLKFNVEYQGNFTKIATLDDGDDPPVLYAEIGKPPWITHAETFSDCVYAQVFDWQYWLEFDPHDPTSKEMTYCGQIRLQSDRCLGALRELFDEVVRTSYTVEGERITEFRFFKSPKERMTVAVETNGAAVIRITGEFELVEMLEGVLLDAFTEDVVPQTFNSVRFAVEALAREIRRGRVAQLRHMFIERPDKAAMATLRKFIGPLRNCVAESDFPKSGNGNEFTLTLKGAGIALHFRRKDEYCWWLVALG